MQQKIKGYFDVAKSWWASLSKKIKSMFAGILAVMLIALAIVLYLNFNKEYSVLFTGLNNTDVTQVVSYLSSNGVTDYKIEGDDTVLVLKEDEARLKAELLIQGYPNSGYGYSTYLDNVSALTTETERETLFLISLQEQMASVIEYFDGVKDANVMIEPGSDNTYVLDSANKTDATAAVIVEMENGHNLSEQYAQAIRQLISHSVEGLEISNVSISDTYGNTYSELDSSFADIENVSELKLQLEERTNNSIKTNIMTVLEPLFGRENIRISVNSVVNVDRSFADSTDYSIEEWQEDGKGIIGQIIYDQEIVRDSETAGGIVGTEENADINDYVEDGIPIDGSESVIHNSGETNYAVDQTNEQVERLAGKIEDVMVSVTINHTAAGSIDEDMLYPHIARAAGISDENQADKINVFIAPFFQEEGDSEVTLPDGTQLEGWMLYAVIGAAAFVILLIIIIIIVASVKRKKRKKREAQEAILQAEQAHLGASVAEWSEVMGDNQPQSNDVIVRNEVRKFAKDHPEVAAQMLKNWLREVK